jgi:hypothetical protein
MPVNQSACTTNVHVNRMTISLDGNKGKYARLADVDVEGVGQCDLRALSLEKTALGSLT